LLPATSLHVYRCIPAAIILRVCGAFSAPRAAGWSSLAAGLANLMR
jgi:hypothetical protein